MGNVSAFLQRGQGGAGKGPNLETDLWGRSGQCESWIPERSSAWVSAGVSCREGYLSTFFN
jgi:hypothetical protein